MASSRARLAPHFRPLLAAFIACVALASSGAARAGNNDLHLLNLCPFAPSAGLGGDSECSWVGREPSGVIPGDVQSRVSDAGKTAFRSLMSELGVVIAPRLQTPADTLGYAGFQFSAELGVTKINADRDYWNGVSGVDPNNPTAWRPSSYLTTLGGFVRKGLWFPLPAFEFGAGAVSILGSGMYAVQGYAKLALQEGFHGWWLPSLAVRGSSSQLLGTNQADLTVWGVDVLISKAFGIAGTSRLEPYLGWNVLFIDASSGQLDATPSCDALSAQQNDVDLQKQTQCTTAQLGNPNDKSAYFTFPSQSIITRYRWSGGFKLKMSVLFLVAEYDYIQAGKSRDSASGAKDQSGSQQSFSFSAGFDF
jgi:hypothetical protein